MAEPNLSAPQAQGQFGNPMFREIHKNAWLTKVLPGSKKKRSIKVWVVFCVHDDTDAFLEIYMDDKLAVFHNPAWFVALNNAQHISPTICPHEQEYEFVLTLTTDVVRLAAPTWEIMLDWVESLRSKLHELKILTPKENLYTKLPDKCQSLLPTRDPTSPLPPPPEVPPENLPGIEPTSTDTNTNNTYQRRRSDSQNSATARSSSDTGQPRSATLSNDVFNFDNFNSVLMPTSAHYEHLFQMQQIPGPSNRNNESRQLERSDFSRVLERSASCSPRILQPVPQPYKTLREQQVLQLKKEIEHPTGVRLQLRKKDCVSSIGFVDAFDAVWICGWKQKEHPMLYNALHIGDRLISIEGITVETAAEAHRILQSHYCGLYVNIVIKRVPHGQVFVIHRESEGQSLGIIQENNTAVIETVLPDSLVARHGLTAKTKSCDGTSVTNWVLTEINGRPLNLFFKKNQVRDRLNSVGKDISILVQPLDLIKQLKKQMKSLKNYKDYILQ